MCHFNSRLCVETRGNAYKCYNACEDTHLGLQDPFPANDRLEPIVVNSIGEILFRLRPAEKDALAIGGDAVSSALSLTRRLI